MARVVSEALALRRTPFGETSQIAEFLTRTRGRLSLILKGVHRPRSRDGGPVDLLDHCQLTWSERRKSRSLQPLVERRVLSHHPRMRSREDLMRGGMYLAELVRAVAPEGQPLPGLFRLALATVQALDQAPDPAAVPSAIFALEGGLLRIAGFEQVLDRCVSCGRRPVGHRALRCDSAQGGIVCSTCRTAENVTFPLSSAAAGVIINLSDADPRSLDEMILPERIRNDVRRFFDKTLTYVLERRPRCTPRQGSAA